MTPSDKRQRDVERDEAWLRIQVTDGTPPDLERIKARVRLAVSEAWLARTVEDGEPEGVVAGAKAAVRAELAEHDNAGVTASRVLPSGGRSRVRMFGWIGGLTTIAAAACVALMIGLQPNAAAGEEMTYVEAFTSFDDDDLTASFTRLGEEFDAMEFVASALTLGDDDGFERTDVDGDEPLPQEDRNGDGDRRPRERS